MTLVIMPMLFMLKTRQQQKKHYPLLSCADVARVLKYCLPHRDFTFEEVMRQLEIRHRQRRSSIESAYRMQMQKSDSMDKILSYLISDT